MTTQRSIVLVFPYDDLSNSKIQPAYALKKFALYLPDEAIDPVPVLEGRSRF